MRFNPPLWLNPRARRHVHSRQSPATLTPAPVFERPFVVFRVVSRALERTHSALKSRIVTVVSLSSPRTPPQSSRPRARTSSSRSIARTPSPARAARRRTPPRARARRPARVLSVSSARDRWRWSASPRSTWRPQMTSRATSSSDVHDDGRARRRRRRRGGGRGDGEGVALGRLSDDAIVASLSPSIYALASD